MKKYFMFALATVAMLSVSSCMNEKDFDLAPDQGKIESEGYGYISLNVSADRTLSTRATVTATPSELESWYVKITGADSYDGQIGSSTSTTTTGLAATAFATGTNYAASVRSHLDLSTALEENNGFGAPYYTGSTETNFTVSAGKTVTPEIACGKAKNAAIKVDVSSSFTDISGATINNLIVTGTNSRRITFIDNTASPAVNNTSRTAYFEAGEVSYSIDYTINKKTKTYPGTITLAAGTLNMLAISSNSNGSITLSITYDNELSTGQTKTVTIDAATGNATVTTVTPPAS